MLPGPIDQERMMPPANHNVESIVITLKSGGTITIEGSKVDDFDMIWWQESALDIFDPAYKSLRSDEIAECSSGRGSGCCSHSIGCLPFRLEEDA
jgi:hypothetical protein